MQPAPVTEHKCERKKKQIESVNEFKEKEFGACGQIKVNIGELVSPETFYNLGKLL